MSSSIGAVEFDLVHGLPAALKLRTEVWEVAGLDGYGALTTGNGDAEFQLRSIVFISDTENNSTTANLVISSVAALQGTAVTVVDDYGDTYDSIIVEHVEVLSKKACIFEDDVNAIRLEFLWKMLSNPANSTPWPTT